jgi:hypothetical protein
VGTPYVWPHDLTLLVIPMAFLAKDQIESGLLRGEQTILVALFVMATAIVLRTGFLPLGPVIVIALVGIILRRILRNERTTVTVMSCGSTR